MGWIDSIKENMAHSSKNFKMAANNRKFWRTLIQSQYKSKQHFVI